jgi:hypothetical protein
VTLLSLSSSLKEAMSASFQILCLQSSRCPWLHNLSVEKILLIEREMNKFSKHFNEVKNEDILLN